METPVASETPFAPLDGLRARRGVTVFVVCLISQALANTGLRLASTASLAAVRAGDFDGGLGDWMGAIFLTGSGLDWMATVGLTVGMWLYAGAARGRSGALTWGAFGCFCGQGLIASFYLVVSILQEATGAILDFRVWAVVWEVIFWLSMTVEVAGCVLLLAAVLRVNRSQNAAPQTLAFLATAGACVLVYGLNVMFRLGVIDHGYRQLHPWMMFSLSTVLSLGFAGAFSALLVGHGRRLAVGPVVSPATGGLELPSNVRRGLATYRTALIWRLAVIVGGMVLLLLAQLGGSMEAAKVLLVVTSVVSLVCGMVMLAGMVRFAAVPEATRARGPALAALSVMIVGLILDLVALVLVFVLISSKNYSTLRSVMKVLPFIELGGQVLALVGVVALLTALLRLGVHVGLPGVRERVLSLGVMLGVTIPAAVAIRLALQFARLQPAAGLALAGLVLVLAVISLALFLGLLGRLIDWLGNPDRRLLTGD